MAVDYSKIQELLGEGSETLLNHTSTTIPRESIHWPGSDFVDRVWIQSDRNPGVLRSLQTLADNGRLGGTGYVSILPVDQGIEHSAGASFAPNPEYFDPENIVKLAIESGCNAVASTYGVLGIVARKYAHKIPFIVKINHNELLTYPNRATRGCRPLEQAKNMGRSRLARDLSARTIYRQSPGSEAFAYDPNGDGNDLVLPPHSIQTATAICHAADLTRRQIISVTSTDSSRETAPKGTAGIPVEQEGSTGNAARVYSAKLRQPIVSSRPVRLIWDAAPDKRAGIEGASAWLSGAHGRGQKRGGGTGLSRRKPSTADDRRIELSTRSRVY